MTSAELQRSLCQRDNEPRHLVISRVTHLIQGTNLCQYCMHLLHGLTKGGNGGLGHLAALDLETFLVQPLHVGYNAPPFILGENVFFRTATGQLAHISVINFKEQVAQRSCG